MTRLSLIRPSLSITLLLVAQVVAQQQPKGQERTSSTPAPPVGVPWRNGDLRRGIILELFPNGHAPPRISASESRFKLADVISPGAPTGESSAASIARPSTPPLQPTPLLPGRQPDAQLVFHKDPVTADGHGGPAPDGAGGAAGGKRLALTRGSGGPAELGDAVALSGSSIATGNHASSGALRRAELVIGLVGFVGGPIIGYVGDALTVNVCDPVTHGCLTESRSNTGMIVGGIVGAVVGLVAFVALGMQQHEDALENRLTVAP